ncbi:MAG: endonuclease/exonuclease/phosphatase family protein [Deltaproteobacteria bacterium]|nr:endonuclease/exonuclease/phosphatase family protein [Deltaproteobacteria bacterium]
MKKIWIKILFILASIAFAIYLAATSTSYPSQQLIHYPEISSTETRPQSLKVMTYNMGYASGDKNNLPVKLKREEVEDQLKKMATALQKENPDILLLQEVDFASQRTFYINQMQFLAKALQLPYAALALTWNKHYVPWPYWPPAVHFGRMVSGQAVLSRFPITEQIVHVFSKPKENPFWYNWFYLNRVAQKVSIDLGEKKLKLFNVHLEAFKEGTNQLQHEELAQLVSAQLSAQPGELFLLGGDFNSPSQFVEGLEKTDEENLLGRQQSLFKLQNTLGLQNAEVSQKNFFSIPSWKPVKKIDHLFYFQNQLNLISAGRVMPLTASDHLPIWAEFKL